MPQKFYSASAKGFYMEGLHKAIPEDAVAITDDEHRALLTEQENGKRIVGDASGKPVAIEHVATTEQKAAWLRRQRNAALAATDGVVARHRDQVESFSPPSLTHVQYSALQHYRQALRDLPQQHGFPDIDLPPKPM